MSLSLRLDPARSWATLLGLALALTSLALAPLAARLAYQPEALASGEYWRLWTGHFVHTGWRHFLADTFIFVATGLWLESLAPRTLRAFLLLAPFALGAALWLAHAPAYSGLSGLGVGLLFLLAFVQLRRDRSMPRGVWVAVIAVVAVKLALEAIGTTPLLSNMGPALREAAIGHLGGAACALLAWPFAAREAGEAPAPPEVAPEP